LVRGWEGTLTFAGREIVFTPVDNKKKVQRIPIERGENLVDHWANFIECCKTKNVQTNSPMDLAYHVQTALIMGFLGLRQSKMAKFDMEKQQVIL
jgi:hypothetical protein